MISKKKYILYSFAAVSLLYILSSVFSVREIELLTKPLFLPILLYYYLRKTNSKSEIHTIICFIAFYIGEMLVLKDPEGFYLISLLFFFIPYLVLLYYVTNDLLLTIKDNALSKFAFFFSLFLLFLILLFVSVILTINTDDIIEKIILYLYGLSLILFGIMTVILYVFKNSKTNFFLLMMVIAFIISDMYFIFMKKIDYNWVFKIVNLVAQIFSYYFFVNYSILRAKNNNV